MTVDTARNATTTGTAPSLTKYMDDKNSVMVYSATAGMGTAPLKDASGKVKAAVAHPYILGFDRGRRLLPSKSACPEEKSSGHVLLIRWVRLVRRISRIDTARAAFDTRYARRFWELFGKKYRNRSGASGRPKKEPTTNARIETANAGTIGCQPARSGFQTRSTP